MDLLKLEDTTLQKLYMAFKDNDGFMVKEDDKYIKATNEILDLDNKELSDLRKLRNNFVYTVSDLISATRMLASIDKSMNRVLNVYMNMMQYVTVEIDERIFGLGGMV